ncbi:MAG: hypothetical protein AAFN77_05500 [Planctomycetota bacterium]
MLAVGTSKQSLQADEVTEVFEAGDPFFFGVSGTNPGDRTSLMNRFATGLPNQGRVRLRDPHSILAAFDNVRFTASDITQSQVDIDFGDVETITVPESTLTSTQFTMSEIDFDADSDVFNFEITANLLGVGPANQLTHFDIATVNSTYSINPVDEGLFAIELTGTGGQASITISGGSGTIMQSLSFRSISPDVVNDELLVTSTRTYFTAIPEPTGVTFGLLCLALVGCQRRRSI